MEFIWRILELNQSLWERRHSKGLLLAWLLFTSMGLLLLNSRTVLINCRAELPHIWLPFWEFVGGTNDLSLLENIQWMSSLFSSVTLGRETPSQLGPSSAGICLLGLLLLRESLLALLNYFGQQPFHSPPVNHEAWSCCSSMGPVWNLNVKEGSFTGLEYSPLPPRTVECLPSEATLCHEMFLLF